MNKFHIKIKIRELYSFHYLHREISFSLYFRNDSGVWVRCGSGFRLTAKPLFEGVRINPACQLFVPSFRMEGIRKIPLYQEGRILSRMFGTEDGVCKESSNKICKSMLSLSSYSAQPR